MIPNDSDLFALSANSNSGGAVKPITEIAADLLTLPDRSTSDEIDGARELDDQSQIRLAYQPLEADSRVFSGTLLDDNILGLSRLLRSLWTVPVSSSVIATMYLLLFSLFSGFDVYLLDTIVLCWGLFITWMFSASLLLLMQIAAMRRTANLFDCVEPDHIVVSPQGIALEWSGKFFALPTYVLSWDDLALAYLEKRKIGDRLHTAFCLRVKSGGTLMLDASAFEARFLAAALKRRAPQVLEDAPLILALQRTKKPMFYRTVAALARICRKQSSPLSTNLALTRIKDNRKELIPGQVLCRGRYRVVEFAGNDERGPIYRAQICSDNDVEPPVQFSRLTVLLGSRDKADGSTNMHEVCVQKLRRPSSDKRRTDEHFAEVKNAFDVLDKINNGKVCRWLEAFAENGETFIVFESVRGTALDQLVAEHGAMREEDALEVGLSIGSVIKEFSLFNPVLVHGQLNPAAIVRTEDGAFRLDRVPMQSVISTRHKIGHTLHRRYLAVEQLRGLIDFRSDLYSLSRIMYFLVTGKEPVPFEQCIIDPELESSGSVHCELAAIIKRATSNDFSERYNSVEEYLAELREALRILRTT